MNEMKRLCQAIGLPDEPQESWTVEMAVGRGTIPAATWVGRVRGEAEAKATALADADTALRAMAWRKRGSGPAEQVPWRVLSAVRDDEHYLVDGLTIEPPALKIPGARAPGRGEQRPVSRKRIEAMARDLGTCLAALAHPLEAKELTLEIGYGDVQPATAEERAKWKWLRKSRPARESLPGTPGGIAARVQTDGYDVELRGPLRHAALAIAMITAHGKQEGRTHDGRPGWTDRTYLEMTGGATSATLAAATRGPAMAKGLAAAGRLADTLRMIGARRAASDLERHFAMAIPEGIARNAA